MSEAATQAAVAECKQMTTLLQTALKEREAQQTKYNALVAEYKRQKGIYDASRAVYLTKCRGDCQSGGVQRYGCDPMCRNWTALNIEPAMPVAPVFPSLGQFICSVCSQSVDMSALNAGDDLSVARNAISQQMTCTASIENEMQKQTQTQSGAGTPTTSTPSDPPVTPSIPKGETSDAPTTTPEPPISGSESSTTSEPEAPGSDVDPKTKTQGNRTILYIAIIFIVLIALAIVIGVFVAQSGPADKKIGSFRGKSRSCY